MVQITERYPAFPPPPVDYVQPTSVNPDDFRQVEPNAPKPVEGTRYGWYWRFISPEIAASRPGRMQEAIAALYAAPEGQEISGPRLQTIQNYVNAYGSDILRATVGTRVSPALVMAVISVESAGVPTAVSHKGAQGLMQLMPATARRFGVKDARNPAENIRGGVAYLDFLMELFDRDPILVLAAYNAGEGAVQRSGGVPRYAETRDYVPKVLAAWDVARGLCLTRPELATDGCVFRR
ncbi:lytic transglycosylase domain-containing protein [Actibacterium pelagium]|nr:lytic transglycosylase domain-containing protein [Actibacterium pelagium]